MTNFGLRVPGGGPVFGQPFHEPEGWVAVLGLSVVSQHPGDLAVHKDMDKLVADDMAELRHGAVCRNDNPSLQEFEESADPLGDESACRVGLLEMEMGAVEDEGDASPEGMVELDFKVTEGLFGEGCASLGEILHLRVVIDVEMCGLQDMPGKIRVLDLISTEIEYLRERGACAQEEKEEEEWRETSHSGGPFVSNITRLHPSLIL
jgi:hypothetical protein